MNDISKERGHHSMFEYVNQEEQNIGLLTEYTESIIQASIAFSNSMKAITNAMLRMEQIPDSTLHSISSTYRDIFSSLNEDVSAMQIDAQKNVVETIDIFRDCYKENCTKSINEMSAINEDIHNAKIAADSAYEECIKASKQKDGTKMKALIVNYDTTVVFN